MATLSGFIDRGLSVYVLGHPGQGSLKSLN